MRSLIKVWGVDWWGDGTELAALAVWVESSSRRYDATENTTSIYLPLLALAFLSLSTSFARKLLAVLSRRLILFSLRATSRRGTCSPLRSYICSRRLTLYSTRVSSASTWAGRRLAHLMVTSRKESVFKKTFFLEAAGTANQSEVAEQYWE
jgi:hypothetical protein